MTDGTVNSEVEPSLDSLNFNWSLLDADISLTKAFRSLAESVASWTEGDGLAAQAALRASLVVAEEIASETRGGDVMLAIQVERLEILAVLLETGLEEADEKSVQQLAGFVRIIIESSLFPPIISLRQPLPKIHRPVLRILFQILQTKADLALTGVAEAGTTLSLEVAAIVLDTVIKGARSDDLDLIIGILCELNKQSFFLDKLLECGLIGQTFEVISRARSDEISAVLLFHLSLASQPRSAEALAISGVMSTYCDNPITSAREQGSSFPRAWSGMLMVVKALLSTLPSASFARSDVVPFIRVSTTQVLRAMAGNGETPQNDADVEEMELVVDIFYGLSAVVQGVLQEYAEPALALLGSLRYTLSHPRQFSTLVITAEEGWDAEFASLEDKAEIGLLDTPILSKRTNCLLRICRTILATLVTFTKALSEDGEMLQVSEYPGQS